MKAIFASQKIDGGGNQSPRELANHFYYDIIDLNQSWENVKAKKQVWYMNDNIYHLLKDDREAFRKVLSYADDIRIVLNFVMGDAWKDSILVDFPVKQIVFLNQIKKSEWVKKTHNKRHSLIPVDVIKPPIGLDRFKKDREYKGYRIGRHSRISLKYPKDPCWIYDQLNNNRFQFSFMLAHPKIKKEFNFKYYEWNEIPVQDFLNQTDIYLAIINPNTHEQAGRSNMEAMAAGCCVVVENRDGPKDYIKHGETGFLVNSEQEALDIINKLTVSDIERIGMNAKNYAFNNFKISNWDKVFKT